MGSCANCKEPILEEHSMPRNQKKRNEKKDLKNKLFNNIIKENNDKNINDFDYKINHHDLFKNIKQSKLPRNVLENINLRIINNNLGSKYKSKRNHDTNINNTNNSNIRINITENRIDNPDMPEYFPDTSTINNSSERTIINANNIRTTTRSLVFRNRFRENHPNSNLTSIRTARNSNTQITNTNIRNNFLSNAPLFVRFCSVISINDQEMSSRVNLNRLHSSNFNNTNHRNRSNELARNVSFPGRQRINKNLLKKLPINIIKGKSNDCNKSCVICLENFKTGERYMTLPCFHFFHEKCAKKWLKKSNKCPICLLEINELNIN